MRKLKIIAIIAAVALLFCGCNKTSPDDTNQPDTPTQSTHEVDQKFSADGMVTIGGETVVVDGSNGFAEPSLGFGLVYSDILQKLIPDNFGFSVVGSSTVLAMYVPDALLDIISDTNAAEEQLQEAYSRYYQCFAIVRVMDEIGDEGKSLLPQLRELYTNEVSAAKLEGVEYIYFYNDTYDDPGLSESEREDVAALAAGMAGLKDNIIAFLPETANGVSFEAFDTTALTGEVVTQDIFAQSKVTMVNIWATWCNPCLDELPDIQDMMDELPEGANVISICLDANTDMELALEIVDTYGLEFKVLIPDENIENNVLRYTEAVPATYFVDSSGKIIGQPIVGAPVDPKAMYIGRMEEILAAMPES
ncbi:MAG: TlpA family protein disulfide reductase [Oscillospiraceae bacterium]|nr:TlpA family protein disulfide reductase [Oscillospiraceae bacterium]